MEFVLFAVPFSARRRRKPVSMTPKGVVVADVKQPEPQAVKQAPINDGGWARRRELYGPKGRKPKRGEHLKLVAAGA
ncbi:hypothetical protein U91I_02797 [alpha proteobacterium U9-1i]|nr:hypothetical protein U91I_02797 [alpha proteobacterium U9-1i]